MPADFAPAVRKTAGAAPAAPIAKWTSCSHPNALPGQECSKLDLPLDYRHPDGPRVSLAVSRLRSDRPRARRGSLLLIPGGPGGSGVQQLSQVGTALRKEMAGAYDIVSLDPRGVGGSTKASCGLAEADRHLVSLKAWPEPDGQIDENIARAKRIAAGCDRNGGAVLRSFSTANEVRDIDRFRQALGEVKLSAWGVSYGTYVGAVYAQKYPQRTDRWVLDSSVDPTRGHREWLANMAAGADDRFADFAAWAADPSRDSEGLRLGREAEDIRPSFLAMAATLDRHPRKTTAEGVLLTGNMMRQALLNSLYSDASFARVAKIMRSVQQPDSLLSLPAELTQALPDHDVAAMAGVICNDARWPHSPATYRRAVADDRIRHPLTAGMPRNALGCAFWKHAPEAKPTRITADGLSNILMIQNLRDPSTPYFGALQMRKALGKRARLVTVGSGGHGVYLSNGNACGDHKVTTFLRKGSRPKKDAYCAG
ncbi:alpha/beta hydrolase [Streptomyces sp. NPDC091263]|uniref:alpha/beta hydrolase n=1 Tax=Streptomyces sp. NPDC091263 TaxID=3155194 RepID=UPI00344EEAB5